MIWRYNYGKEIEGFDVERKSKKEWKYCAGIW